MKSSRPDGEINPIEIEIEAPVSTQEWRLYRTVDNGPLGLVRQGVFSGPAPNPVLFVVNDLILNPTGAPPLLLRAILRRTRQRRPHQGTRLFSKPRQTTPRTGPRPRPPASHQ